MPTLHFNHDQKLELSKAFFNFGNIIAGAVIVNQAVFGVLTFSTFIFGLFCFVILFTTATLLLRTERN
jgi:hypothetical protein